MGKFVKGMPKPPNSGRGPGVGNRVPAKIFADVLEQLEQRNFSAIDEAVKLYRSRKTNVEMKVRLLSVLSTVAFPKKMAIAAVKKVEHSISPATMAALMRDPSIAAAMERITFAAGQPEPAGYLPAPEPGVVDAEFTDVPNVHEREPGEGLST